MLLVDGIRRASLRNSFSNHEWLETGTVYQLDITLPSVAVTIPADHRLRVVVASSNFPRFDVNVQDGSSLSDEDGATATPATVRVLLGPDHPSRIELPLAAEPAPSPCPSTPVSGCRQPAIPGKGMLLLRNREDQTRDRFTWRWKKGTATTAADFGDPLTRTDYLLCLYDQSASQQPVLLAKVPAEDTRAEDKKCWGALGKNPPGSRGFKYKNEDRTPEGVDTLLLKPGRTKEAAILLEGKGLNLAMPPLPLTLPVTVQLHAAGGPCWEAQYSSPSKNDPGEFRAKND
jgi:hypothetical protein